MRYLTILLLCLGCSSPSGPGAKEVNKEFGKPYQGLRAAVPDLLEGERRLDIFLGILPEVPEGEEAEVLVPESSWANVVYCVARNEDKDPLPEVAALIASTPPDMTIYIWGSPITRKHGFFWDGVDCEAEAIAVYHPKAEDYVYYDLIYARPWWQWRNIKSGLKSLVDAGRKVKKVIP